MKKAIHQKCHDCLVDAETAIVTKFPHLVENPRETINPVYSVLLSHRCARLLSVSCIAEGATTHHPTFSTYLSGKRAIETVERVFVKAKGLAMQ